MPDTNNVGTIQKGKSRGRSYTRGKEAERSVDAYQNEGATRGTPTKKVIFLHIQLHLMHVFISFCQIRNSNYFAPF